jgi:hypothetical protein
VGAAYYVGNRISREAHVWLNALDSLEHIDIGELDYRRRLFDAEYSFRIEFRGPIGDFYESQMIGQGRPGSPLAILVHGSIYHGPILFHDGSYRAEQAFSDFELYRPDSHRGILIDGKEGISGEITSRFNGDYLLRLAAPEYDGPLTINDDEVRLALRPSNLRLDYSNELERVESILSIGDISMLEGDAISLSLRGIEGASTLVESAREVVKSDSVLTIEELAFVDLKKDQNSTKIGKVKFQAETEVGKQELRSVRLNFHLSALSNQHVQIEGIDISVGAERDAALSLPWGGSFIFRLGRVMSEQFRASELLASVEADVSEDGVALKTSNSAESFYMKEVSSDTYRYKVEIGLGNFGSQEFNNFQNDVLRLMRDPLNRYSDPYDLGVATRESFRQSFTQESQDPIKLALLVDWKEQRREVHFTGELPIDLNEVLESGDVTGIFYPNKGVQMHIEVSHELLDLIEAQQNEVASYLMNLDPQRTDAGYRFLIEERNGEMFVGDTNITEEYVEFLNGMFDSVR